LVSSGPFRAIIRRTAKIAHKTILSETGREISLSVSDVGVILQSALSNTPELAKKIPRATTLLGNSNEAPGGRIIIRLVRFAHRLRIGGLALLLIGIVMGVTSFLLASDRRKFLLRIGIALVVIALIIRLTVRFGGQALALTAKDELVGRALAGLWHAFLSGLMVWSLILGGIAVVIVAGVSSFFRRIELLKISATVGNWLTKAHVSNGIRFLRVVILISFGMTAVLFPSFVMTVLGLIAGVVLVFIGLRELFSVVLSAIPQKERQTAIAVANSPNSLARMIAITLIALLIAFAGIYYLMF
jgi:hypothetical protein